MAPVNRLDLGQYIKQAREKKGISLRELGREAGVDASSLSRIESGDRVPVYSPDKLARIARVLDIGEHDLYALAGFSVPEGLPELAPYLKTKYKLSDGAVDDMENYLRAVTTRYEQKGADAPDSD